MTPFSKRLKSIGLVRNSLSKYFQGQYLPRVCYGRHGFFDYMEGIAKRFDALESKNRLTIDL